MTSSEFTPSVSKKPRFVLEAEVDAGFTSAEAENFWRFTGFYGDPNSNKRHFSWDLLCRLHSLPEFRGVPWLVGDLHGSGELFTWVNRRSGNDLIFELLDHYVGTFAWRVLYPVAHAQSLEFFHSDHRPILLALGQTAPQAFSYASTFKFETHWASEADCPDVISEGWCLHDDSMGLSERISHCKEALLVWAGGRFRCIPRKLRICRDKLNRLKNHECWHNSADLIQRLEKNIETLSTKEEIYWKQRSRVSWLAHGDRNSKYFHACASSRRVQHLINGLVSSHGDWCSDKSSMADIVVSYFSDLFLSNNPSEQDLQYVTEHIESKIDAEMNQQLCAQFSSDEVKKALFDMHPDKAPGPDGMSTFFFQKYWQIIGKEVTSAVLRILNDGVQLSDWNDTISAFVPGRLIIDNILLGFEALHWIRSRKTGKKGFAALNLDMSKAYDRIEWNFLENITGKLGFAHSWVEKVMRCVRSVNYSFRLNGEIIGKVNPSRGSRQGDPLSPFLFVLCAQGLSSIFSSFEARKLISGVRLATSCPPISHLLFADDSLIFFKATLEECHDGSWNANLLNSILPNYIVQNILAIPISLSLNEDSRYWYLDPNGHYSVKDGYKLEIGFYDSSENSSHLHSKGWWKFLWSMSVPPKVRIFWWRAMLNIITTQSNLMVHHVPVTGLCPLCQYGFDSTCHALFFCPMVKQCWKNSLFKSILKQATSLELIDIFLWMKAAFLNSELESFVMRVWAVWQERLRIIHVKDKLPARFDIEWSDILLHEFNEARAALNLSVVQNVRVPSPKWKQPGLNKLKLDVNVQINEATGDFSIGGLVRNHEGQALLAFANRILKPPSKVFGDLVAVREGLRLVQERGMNIHEIVTDSLLAVQAVTNPAEDVSYTGNIAMNIRCCLDGISGLNLSHVTRTANLAAHGLALFALVSSSPCSWEHENLPSWLVNLVLNDLS
ncbi:uncharacterized protein [Henckelia pumila]|uniref:uncharacterized protein n=1 Tax=Henckelia pumila TaxID=405737 RepID=UPI003C6E2464